jgi:hypothetical protein
LICRNVLGGYMEDSSIDELAATNDETLTFAELRARCKGLIDSRMAEQAEAGEIEEDKEDIMRMLETQLSTALMRMDARGARKQVLLPRRRPHVIQEVQEVNTLDEIQLEPSDQPASLPPSPPGSPGE